MYLDEYKRWLAADLEDADLKPELSKIEGNDEEIKDRFAVALKFGTAGLRGIMAVGLHNMNIHVIRWATQGFAQVICAEGEEGKRRGVAICMDCRNHSMEFARAAAEVATPVSRTFVLISLPAATAFRNRVSSTGSAAPCSLAMPMAAFTWEII
mgnify:CR=1 FL=1